MALAAVPLLFTGTSTSAQGTCVGVGSIDGLMVPQGVEAAARQAGQRAGMDELVLLTVTYRETRWGQAAAGVPDDQASAWLGDLAADVDLSALRPGGAVGTLVGRPRGIRLGDWANAQPVGSEHALGFAQFLPSTWRHVGAAHARPGGGSWDPYSPLDALTLAGYYLSGLLRSSGGDVNAAVQRYGTTGFPSAYQQLRATWHDACAATDASVTGDPFGGLCRPRTLQAYLAVEVFTPDGRHHGIDLACQEGATLFSVTAGTVFDVASGCSNGARNTCGAGYGNHVVVRFHGRVPGDTADHDYYVIYGHMLTTPLVGRGLQVKPGMPLGQQGDSGLSWGSHLHLEVDRDSWNTLRSIDPGVLLPPSISRTAQV
jgi:hypothetical protein